MNHDILKKYKNVSYSNGKFISDKSYAYDTLYFISKYILDYMDNDNTFNYKKWKLTLEDYIADKFQLLDKNDGLLNYYHESVSLLEYANVLSKNKKKIIIKDINSLKYITEKMENSYIFIYTLCYYTALNSYVLDDYIAFCNEEEEELKINYVNKIYKKISALNLSIKNPNVNTQWALQNTQYMMNVLNYINHQPWITRNLTLDDKRKDNSEMISVNVKGPKTKYEKKNHYLKDFDNNYVRNVLKEIIIK